MKILKILIMCALLPFLASAQDSTYVYVSVQGSNIISVFSENADGSLTKVEDEAVSGGPASIAISPDKKFMYVSQRSTNTFSSYSINQGTGELTFIASIAAIDNPVNISTDNTGRYLLSVYYAASKAAIYEIDPSTGIINSTALSSFSTAGINPHAIKTDSSNQFLYITNMTGNLMQQYAFDASTGTVSALAPATVSPSGTDGPRHFVYHGSKDLVYIANELSNTVTVYSFNVSTGLLSEIQKLSTLPSSFVDVNKVADVHITPDNQFLYVSNRGHDSLAGFIIDTSTGLLTTNGYYPTETSPRAFDIDPAGEYLYAAGETSGSLSYYHINQSTGVLDSIAAYVMGANPSWVKCVSFKTQTAINCLDLATIAISSLAIAGTYKVVLFDASGNTQIKELGEGVFNAGDTNFLFSPAGISTGTYTYKLMNGTIVVKLGTIVLP